MRATHQTTSEADAVAERLRAALELLESVVADRTLLAKISNADRERLVQAAGEVFCPDVGQRRRLTKAQQRRRKAAKAASAEEVLTTTGIRELRRKPVFTTPNVPLPANVEQQEMNDPDFREVVEPQNCYICKRDYSQVHHFYDQLCPACAGPNFHKRAELADLRG